MQSFPLRLQQIPYYWLEMNWSLWAGGMNGALIGLTEYMRSWLSQ